MLCRISDSALSWWIYLVYIFLASAKKVFSYISTCEIGVTFRFFQVFIPFGHYGEHSSSICNFLSELSWHKVKQHQMCTFNDQTIISPGFTDYSRDNVWSSCKNHSTPDQQREGGWFVNDALFFFKFFKIVKRHYLALQLITQLHAT